MKNKRGFEFSFGWIFAIIVGAVILFLGIYAAMNLVKGTRNTSDTFAGKELGIILNPIETSTEDFNKPTPISFPVETRVYNTCDSMGNFGSQKISVATKSNLGKPWEKPGIPSTFYNKYIFSASTIEGKSATLFAKPFNFPYKVADLVFMWSNNDSYCFVNAPDEMKEELLLGDVRGVNFTSSPTECKKGSKKICFSSLTGAGCNIEVNLASQSVKKNGQTVYYYTDKGNALLYGAIFADPGIYECQVKRLMKRTAALALIYISKSESLAPRGCSSNLEGDLSTFVNQTLSLNSTIELRSLEMNVENIGRTNNALSCKLF